MAGAEKGGCSAHLSSRCPFAAGVFAAGAIEVPLSAQPSSNPETSVGTLAPIPLPLPFPKGSSVFQWDYQCIPQKACEISGFGLRAQTFTAVSIVLANITVGDLQLPTYFIWGTLINGNRMGSMTQYPPAFTSRFVNMRLIAAGVPGL
jgi:hypothetical protein